MVAAAAAAAEKLQSDGAQGASKPPPSLQRSRQLQEIGRQSSSDSGIATGSHSSYSGSFSSYAGSLDICHGDEFGSLLSLSLSFPSDRNVCSCRSPGSEYQAPSWLRHNYDTPRSLLAASTTGILAIGPDAGLSKTQSSKGDGKRPAPHLEREAANRPSQDKDSQGVSPLGSTKGSVPETQLRPPVQGQDWRGPEVAPCVSGGSCELCSSPSAAKTALFPSCPVCGGIQVKP